MIENEIPKVKQKFCKLCGHALVLTETSFLYDEETGIAEEVLVCGAILDIFKDTARGGDNLLRIFRGTNHSAYRLSDLDIEEPRAIRDLINSNFGNI